MSGTAGDPLTPQTGTAYRPVAADAIVRIALPTDTAAAIEAGGKVVGSHPITKMPVWSAVPNFTEALFIYAAEGVAHHGAYRTGQTGLGAVQQPHTGHDFSVPADKAVPLIDEAAGILLPQQRLPAPEQCPVTVQQPFDAGVFGQIIHGHPDHGDLRFGLVIKMGIEVILEYGLVRQRLFFHGEGIRDHVADVYIVGEDGVGKVFKGGELHDVALHDNKGQTQLCGAAPAYIIEKLHVPDDLAEAAAHLDLAIAIRVKAVDGDPDLVNAERHQLFTHVFPERGTVGDQLHFFAAVFRGPDHFHDLGVKKGLTHTAEKHSLHKVEEDGLIHHGQHGLRPDVAEAFVDPRLAEAHLTAEIAEGGGLNVELDRVGGDLRRFSVRQYPEGIPVYDGILLFVHTAPPFFIIE